MARTLSSSPRAETRARRRREDKFLYLGPGTVPLEEGGRLDLGQERYMVQAAHSIGPGLFWQGVLRPMDEERGS